MRSNSIEIIQLKKIALKIVVCSRMISN